MEKGNRINAVYLDVDKPFDNVDHIIFIEKLRLMDFSQLAVEWISNYLSHCSQVVKLVLFILNQYKITLMFPRLVIWDLCYFCYLLIICLIVKKLFNVKILVLCWSLQYDVNCVYEWCYNTTLNLNTAFAKSFNTILFVYSKGDAMLKITSCTNDLE